MGRAVPKVSAQESCWALKKALFYWLPLIKIFLKIKKKSRHPLGILRTLGEKNCSWSDPQFLPSVWPWKWQ